MSEDLENDEITSLIDQARNGNAHAEARLCEQVFAELHQIAQRTVLRDDTSLQPTMLVNDLFVKLFRKNGLKKTENRRYFFAVAADQMRKMLIDHLRRKKRQKAGGNLQRESFELVMDGAIAEFQDQNQVDLNELDEALEKLYNYNSRLHEVVMQRFFVGLTIAETASLLGISESSVERDWRLARAKLHIYLQEL